MYLAASKAIQCPPLLRDLLATTELEKTFGKSVVSTLLDVLAIPLALHCCNPDVHAELYDWPS